jgi:hypothetical protein
MEWDNLKVTKTPDFVITPVNNLIKTTFVWFIINGLQIKVLLLTELNSLFIYHRSKLFHFPAYVITLCKLPL